MHSTIMRKALLQNLPLKVIALVLACVVFLIVRSDKTIQTTLEVPLLLRVPDGYVMVNEPLESIHVQIHGRWSQIRELRVDELGPITLSLNPGEGRTNRTFTPEQFRVPPGLEVVGFDPPSIVVALEEQTRKEVPVAIDRVISKSPPPGYQLGEVRVDPPKVQIAGPRSVVETVHQVFVEPIDVTGRTTNFVEERYVVPDRRAVEVAGSARVSVSVQVVAKAQQKVVSGVPVLLLNLTRSFEVLPKEVELELVGEEQHLALVDPARLVVTIDGTELETQPAGSRRMTVEPSNIYNLPPGVGVEKGRLPTIFVRTHPLAPPPPSQLNPELETVRDGVSAPDTAP